MCWSETIALERNPSKSSNTDGNRQVNRHVTYRDAKPRLLHT
jgi:hypothetical protein